MKSQKQLTSRMESELTRRSLVTRIAGIGTGLALASTDRLAARDKILAAESPLTAHRARVGTVLECNRAPMTSLQPAMAKCAES